MDPQDLHALAFGFVSGALILVTGVGAGVLVVPGLITMFGLPPAQAVGTASVFAVLTKVMAGLSHLLAGNVSGPLSASFLRAALPATLTVAVLVNLALAHFPGQAARMQLGLKLAVLLAAASALAVACVPALTNRLGAAAGRTLALVCGVLVGGTGVGGGVLIVPTLMTASREPVKRVIGTSVVLGLVLSAATGVVYGTSGTLAWRTALLMSAGALTSLPVAGHYFRQATGQHVRLLSVLLIGVSVAAMAIDVAIRR
jgi:uncharacterized membrane protein YfcA